MGNICRSPAAEGTFRHTAAKAGILNRIQVDSAGTHAYHTGSPPDFRSQAAAAESGIQLKGQARRIQVPDLSEFSLILAMDNQNYRGIQELAEKNQVETNLRLFRQFDPEFITLHRIDYSGISKINEIPFHSGAPDVPDPYYGGADGFLNVQKMILRTSEKLTEIIKQCI